MGRTFVQAALIYGVGYFIWEDAGAQAGDELLDTVLLAEDIHIIL